MGKTEDSANQVVKLQHPVDWGGELVTEVSIRRPKGKDMKGLKNLSNSHDDQMKFMARLINMPERFVEELDLATDLTAIMEVVAGFLPDGP